MRSSPVPPVITGNIPTRKRSTSPARRRDRHRLRLPIVLRSPNSRDFMARTASTASSRTSVEFAHVSGSSSEEENTTLDERELVDRCLFFGPELVLAIRDLTGGK